MPSSDLPKHSKSTSGPGGAYQDHHFRSSQNLGPRPTPTIPKGGVWSVYAEIDINVPPKYPYDAVVSVHEWREWNTFNPDVIITKHPNPHAGRQNLKMEQGTFMTFTVQITPDIRETSKERCEHLEPLKHKDDGHASHAQGGNITRIRWVLDNANLFAPGFIMKTERVNEIEEMPNGGTKYRTWITFAGMGAKSWKKKYSEAIQQRVQDFCRDLKRRSEELYAKDAGFGSEGDKNPAVQENGHAA
ncbi:hypothetical protein CLAFUR4_07478 [Fulvia fulva]|nr:hypothetical protein CLAFUR4_07478 [Fulvia fulva]